MTVKALKDYEKDSVGGTERTTQMDYREWRENQKRRETKSHTNLS